MPAPCHRGRPSQGYQKAGLFAVSALRRAFDLATGYGPEMTEVQWLRRCIFLETIAGGLRPGFCAALFQGCEQASPR